MDLRTPRVDTIQVLRGVAALIIALGHLDNYADVHNVTKGVSWVGIDLFFVISGFVIAYTVLPNRDRKGYAREFLIKRLVRIYPTYWLVCAIGIGVALWTGHRAHLDWYHYIAAFFLFPQRIAEQFIPVAWSLHLELLFYAVITLILWACPKHFWRAIVVWCVYLFIAQFFVTINPGPRFDWALYFTSAYQFEFLCGLLVGALIIHRDQFVPPSARVLWFLAVSGVLIAMGGLLWGEVALTAKQKFGDYQVFHVRCAVLGISFALLIYALAILEIRGLIRVRQGGWMLRIGNASYVLYLIHDMVFICLGRLWEMITGYVPVANPPLSYSVYMPLAVVSMIWISVFLSERVERPMIDAIRTRSLRRHREMAAHAG